MSGRYPSRATCDSKTISGERDDTCKYRAFFLALGMGRLPQNLSDRLLVFLTSAHPRLRRLNPLVYRRDAHCQVLPTAFQTPFSRGVVPGNQESCIANHPGELCLTRELLNALDEILIAIAIRGDDLTDQRYRAETPAFVDGVE